MDKFPDNFNRQYCHDIIEKNQLDMIKKIRKEFYDIIEKSLVDCNKEVQLPFPSKLWNEHRLTIAKELLERFGKIIVKINNNHSNATKPVTKIEEIPKDVNVIILEFFKNM